MVTRLPFGVAADAGKRRFRPETAAHRPCSCHERTFISCAEMRPLPRVRPRRTRCGPGRPPRQPARRCAGLAAPRQHGLTHGRIGPAGLVCLDDFRQICFGNAVEHIQHLQPPCRSCAKPRAGGPGLRGSVDCAPHDSVSTIRRQDQGRRIESRGEGSSRSAVAAQRLRRAFSGGVSRPHASGRSDPARGAWSWCVVGHLQDVGLDASSMPARGTIRTTRRGGFRLSLRGGLHALYGRPQRARR